MDPIACQSASLGNFFPNLFHKRNPPRITMPHGRKGIAKPVSQRHESITHPDKRSSTPVWLRNIRQKRQQHERIAGAGAAARQLIQQLRKVACSDNSGRKGSMKHIVNQAQGGVAVNPLCTSR